VRASVQCRWFGRLRMVREEGSGRRAAGQIGLAKGRTEQNEGATHHNEQGRETTTGEEDAKEKGVAFSETVYLPASRSVCIGARPRLVPFFLCRFLTSSARPVLLDSGFTNNDQTTTITPFEQAHSAIDRTSRCHPLPAHRSPLRLLTGRANLTLKRGLVSTAGHI
jgi:hypothetical protein